MSGPLPDTADVSILVTSSLALANVSNLTVAPVWVLNWLAMSCCQAANSFGNCVFAPMYTSSVWPAPLVPPPEPPESPPPPPQAARPRVTVVAASTARAERTVVDRICFSLGFVRRGVWPTSRPQTFADGCRRHSKAASSCRLLPSQPLQQVATPCSGGSCEPTSGHGHADCASGSAAARRPRDPDRRPTAVRGGPRPADRLPARTRRSPDPGGRRGVRGPC